MCNHTNRTASYRTVRLLALAARRRRRPRRLFQFACMTFESAVSLLQICFYISIECFACKRLNATNKHLTRRRRVVRMCDVCWVYMLLISLQIHNSELCADGQRTTGHTTFEWSAWKRRWHQLWWELVHANTPSWDVVVFVKMSLICDTRRDICVHRFDCDWVCAWAYEVHTRSKQLLLEMGWRNVQLCTFLNNIFKIALAQTRWMFIDWNHTREMLENTQFDYRCTSVPRSSIHITI